MKPLLFPLLGFSVLGAIGAPAPEPTTRNGIGMEFVLIPAGKMTMGRYNPNVITLPAPAVPRGGVAPTPAPAAAPTTPPPVTAGVPGSAAPAAPATAAVPQGGGRGAGGAARGPAWTPEQFKLAEELLKQDIIEGFKVALPKAYYIGKYEVTQGEWKKVMGSNPSVFQGSKVTDEADRHPVDSVSWADAQAFIKKLNALEKTTAYRLPTEAEWEYAARAGAEEAPMIPGEQVGVAYVNNKGPSSVVGGNRKPNAFGAYDMIGNLWEWVQDFYNEKIVPDAVPPKRGTQHVLKGGSFLSHVKNLGSSVHAGGPGDPLTTGFRLVKEVR